MKFSQIFLLTALMTGTAFAQSENTMSTTVDKFEIGNAQKGIFVGAEYMNMTDIKVQTGTDNERLDAHVGMAGVRVGYNQTPDVGFGFNAAVSYLESLNKSEMENKMSFFIPSGNLTYGFQKYVTGFAGFNVAIMDQPHEAKSIFKPSIGLQAGMAARFTKNVALNAGYTLLSQSFKYTKYEGNGTSSERDDGYFYMGGFNTNLTYTF